jgi:hypothetical protein
VDASTLSIPLSALLYPFPVVGGVTPFELLKIAGD